MKITEVTLSNFRPFYEDVTVDLTTEKDKPLTLIGAKNDRGKSALFEGIKFCLYGYDKANRKIGKKRKRAVNRRAAREQKGKTSVTVQFTHSEEVYEVERIITFTSLGDEEVEIAGCYPVVRKNGNEIIGKSNSTTEYNEFINPILPQNASKFFFFDAEEDLEKYTRSNEEVRQAIETVIGIEEIRNAVEDLEDREKEYNKKFLSSQSDVERKNNLKEETKELHKKIEDLKKEKENIESELEGEKESLDNIKSEIEGIADVAEKNEKIDKIEGDIERAETEKVRAQQEIDSIVRESGQIIASVGAADISKYTPDTESGSTDKEIRKAVEKILKERERCICGEELDDEHRENLMEHLEEEQESLFESYRTDLGSLGQEIEVDVEAKKGKFTRQRQKKREKEEKIDELENKKEGLKDEIDAITKKDDERLKRRKDETEERIEELDEELQEIIKEIGEKEAKIKRKKKRIDGLGSPTEDEKRYSDLEELSGRCAKAFESLKQELVDQRREAIEQRASEIFMNLTNKPDVYEGIKLDEEYKLSVKTSSGLRRVQEQDSSKGGTQIIAYSFIAGLNKFTARDAPVIIDTPLGRLDTIHKDRLISYFPQFGDQVVILYQPSELNRGDIDVMENRVSKHKMIETSDEDPTCSVVNDMDQRRLRAE